MSVTYEKVNLGKVKGEDGKTPYVKDGYWYIDGKSTGVPVSGIDLSIYAKVSDIQSGKIQQFKVPFYRHTIGFNVNGYEVIGSVLLPFETALSITEYIKNISVPILIRGEKTVSSLTYFLIGALLPNSNGEIEVFCVTNSGVSVAHSISNFLAGIPKLAIEV